MAKPIVLKFGGELLEEPERVRGIARVVKKVAAGTPLVVVHGGGREIDRALAAAGIIKQQVDGIRVTDIATLDVVVAVLAGTLNTRLVAALGAAGVAAVGLTGADATVAPVKKAAPLVTATGTRVSLGHVGAPVMRGTATVLHTLLEGGFVPVVASVSASRQGELFNVNADTLAAAIAVRAGARRLVVAGTTAGVHDANGAPIPTLDQAASRALVAGGTASAGMVAKLAACRTAVAGGVKDVRIADGRTPAALLAALTAPGAGSWTTVN